MSRKIRRNCRYHVENENAKAAGLRKILVKKLTYYKMQASWGSGREYYFLNKQKGKKYFFQFLLPLGLFHVRRSCMS